MFQTIQISNLKIFIKILFLLTQEILYSLFFASDFPGKFSKWFHDHFSEFRNYGLVLTVTVTVWQCNLPDSEFSASRTPYWGTLTVCGERLYQIKLTATLTIWIFSGNCSLKHKFMSCSCLHHECIHRAKEQLEINSDIHTMKTWIWSIEPEWRNSDLISSRPS